MGSSGAGHCVQRVTSHRVTLGELLSPSRATSEAGGTSELAVQPVEGPNLSTDRLRIWIFGPWG